MDQIAPASSYANTFVERLLLKVNTRQQLLIISAPQHAGNYFSKAQEGISDLTADVVFISV